jgi:hypothetical protein
MTRTSIDYFSLPRRRSASRPLSDEGKEVSVRSYEIFEESQQGSISVREGNNKEEEVEDA